MTSPAPGDPSPMLFGYDYASKLTGFSEAWLRRQVRAGHLPHRKFPNSRRIGFTRADIETFLDAGRVGGNQ